MPTIEQLVAFATQHWILSSLLGLVLVAILVNEWMNRNFGPPQIAPESAVQLINHQEALVLDIRAESAFATGHILDSQCIPASALEKKMGSLQKYTSKPIIVVCALGQSAVKVAVDLQKQGFQKVFVLNGGIQSWKTAGLPLVKK
jgi:rhodanese-related sulfurtransferase